MKRLFPMILLLVLSLSAHASIDSYSCFSLDTTYTQIDVPFEKCSLTLSSNFDVCQTDLGKLIIAVDPRKSIIINELGETQEFSCRETELAPRAPQQFPHPAPAPGSSRSSEPGHGGSNIRGRGLVKDITI